MLKIYSLLVLGIGIIFACYSMVADNRPKNRLGSFLGMIVAIPVFYYIWIT